MSAAVRPVEIRATRVSVPLITGIIIALCVLLFRQTGKLRETQQWVEHSYEVKLEVEALERSLREAESIQRAMLLSGADAPAEMLGRLDELLADAADHIRNLSVLVEANAGQMVLVREAEALKDARVGILMDNVRDFPSLDAKLRTERILKGVAIADALERKLGEIRTSEQALLDERSKATDVQAKRLLAMATGGSFLALVVMLLALWQERRNSKLRRRYQNRLAEARDAALDSVQATSVFVASVSHEIRTPMNGVLGAADLLRNDGRLDRRQRELVDTIRHSGEALLELVNDILDLSKLQAGKMEFIQEEFLLVEVLDETLAVLADEAGRKNLELACRVDPSLPRRFRSDPRRLRQVLLNLVGNAVKFTDSGSVLVEVMSRGGDGGEGTWVLRFSVVDTGPGISVEERKHLFQPFSQVNPTLRLRHGGTGLGLAISQEIVHRLGGGWGWRVSREKGASSGSPRGCLERRGPKITVRGCATGAHFCFLRNVSLRRVRFANMCSPGG